MTVTRPENEAICHEIVGFVRLHQPTDAESVINAVSKHCPTCGKAMIPVGQTHRNLLRLLADGWIETTIDRKLVLPALKNGEVCPY